VLASDVKLAYCLHNEQRPSEGALIVNRLIFRRTPNQGVIEVSSLFTVQSSPTDQWSQQSVPPVGSCGCSSVSLAGNAGQTHYLAPPSRVWSVDGSAMAGDYTRTRRCRLPMSSLGWLKNRLYMHRLIMTMKDNDLQVVAGDSDTLVIDLCVSELLPNMEQKRRFPLVRATESTWLPTNNSGLKHSDLQNGV